MCIFGTGYHFFTIVDFIMISLRSRYLVAFADHPSGVDSTVGVRVTVTGIQGRETAQPTRVIAELDDNDDGLLTIVSMDEPRSVDCLRKITTLLMSQCAWSGLLFGIDEMICIP
jgi:hypothetical protein